MIRQCQDRLAQLQRSHTPSNSPSSHILCNPSHTPFTPMPPLVPPLKNVPWFLLPKTSSKCRKTEIITQEHVTTIPSLYHPQIHTVLLSTTQPVSISPHTPPPPHSQYIQPLSRVPTGVNLPIYTSHSQYIPPYSPRPNPNLPTYTPYSHG